MGTIKAICKSDKKGTKKTAVESAALIKNHGIDGDAHSGEWHRQISLLAEEDIQTIREQGLTDLQPGDFAENIVTTGIDISSLGLGSRLQVGEAELIITQIGKTCHTGCEIQQKTGNCIMPRLGLFARVTKGGNVATGDTLEVLKTVPRELIQAVVLTVSDRCSRGEAEDTAGPAVSKLIKKELGANVYVQEIIPDEIEIIKERLSHYSEGHSIDMIAAVGGTGFAPTDVTPEAVSAIIDRPTPGLDEAMRAGSLAVTPNAMLSRSVSGIKNSTLIISLPGSERGATENLAFILPALAHGISKLRGDKSDCGRPQNL